MTISYEDFIKKYKLDDLTEKLELKTHEKIDFYNDLNEIMKTICKIFDKITNIASLRGGQVLMSLAKLNDTEAVINKTDIKKNLNIDRLEKLTHSFEYLEHQNYIKVEKKSSKFHIIKLNKKENPDFKLFQEVVQKFWSSPEDDIKRIGSWRDS
ncbi:hypothetical protein LCGC14_0524390 [marine sediment metagenome]|uniref:Uncharacterized protein n=1 Tax=marine sediment metagenome TaxID=412755 RepID=A0A0F9V5M6_9ZZZZ